MLFAVEGYARHDTGAVATRVAGIMLGPNPSITLPIATVLSCAGHTGQDNLVSEQLKAAFVSSIGAFVDRLEV